jgi:hypothetical protein
MRQQIATRAANLLAADGQSAVLARQLATIKAQRAKVAARYEAGRLPGFAAEEALHQLAQDEADTRRQLRERAAGRGVI